MIPLVSIIPIGPPGEPPTGWLTTWNVDNIPTSAVCSSAELAAELNAMVTRVYLEGLRDGAAGVAPEPIEPAQQ